jgi:GT2 family glycosyltransferase
MDSVRGMSAEIIVVDNASTDGTIELIEREFPGARLIKNSANFGFARAVNQGLNQSAGELILVLNQDVKLKSDAVFRLARRLKEDPGIGVIGPKFIGFDGRLQKLCRAFPKYRDIIFEAIGLAPLFPNSRFFSHWKMRWFDHETSMEVDQPMGSAMMFRRELLKAAGDFDESFPIFFNDVDFCRRVKEAGLINLYYPEAVVEHYLGGSTERARAAMIMESHRSMYRYFRKYAKSIHARLILYFMGGIIFFIGVIRAAAYLILRVGKLSRPQETIRRQEIT